MKQTLEQQAQADAERTIQFNRFLKNIQRGHFGLDVDHSNIKRDVKEGKE